MMPPPPPLLPLELLEPPLLRDEPPLLRDDPPLERPTLLLLPPPGRASTKSGVAIQSSMANRSAARITTCRFRIKPRESSTVLPAPCLRAARHDSAHMILF